MNADKIKAIRTFQDLVKPKFSADSVLGGLAREDPYMLTEVQQDLLWAAASGIIACQLGNKYT